MRTRTSLVTGATTAVVGALSLAAFVGPGASAVEMGYTAARGTDQAEVHGAESNRATVSHSSILWFLESDSFINLHCPDSHPYLINQKLAERSVPFGVSVDERGDWGMAVTAMPHERNGYQSGVRDMIITNLDVSNMLGTNWARVTLHCTNDTSEARPS